MLKPLMINGFNHRRNIKRISRFCAYVLLYSSSLIFLETLLPISNNQSKASTSREVISSQSFVTAAVKKAGPAVVTIETQRKVFTQGNSAFPPGLLMDPYFQRFFGFEAIPYPRSKIERGQGSGVVFSLKGLVLTNAHVVQNTDELIVGLSDGRRVRGKVMGQDRLTDLAVIRLEGDGPWPKAPLGNSDLLSVGDWAIAVGNPYGLENTVTLGIISNLNRNVAQLGISNKRMDLIQTDAAINPGNSGGPLLNSNGEVIGINTLVRTGPGAGLGFAIPINRAKAIAEQLINKGKVIHPIIGVSLSKRSEVSSDFGKDFSDNGAIIKYVIPNGPGELGGLRVGDLIISLNNKQVKGPSDVVRAINENGIKKEMKFIIKRENRKILVLIKPVDMNELLLER